MGLFSGGWSPESALKQTFKDLKSDGIEGVKKHLTNDAAKKLDNIEAWADYPLFDIIATAVTGNTKDTLIMEKISEYDFSIANVLKGKDQTKAIVRFKHKNGASGTVEVDMVKEGTAWKINSLNTPKYD